MKRLEYSWHIALPFLLAAAAGALNAVLPAISNYHPSTQAGILTMSLALVAGDWLRAQIARWKQDAAPDAQGTFIEGHVEGFASVALPALPLVDAALLADLVNETIRTHLASTVNVNPPAEPPAPAPLVEHPPPPAITPAVKVPRSRT